MIDAFRDLERRRTAAGLSSGLLDNVPILDLATAFEEVRLVDAVHPWPTRRATRGLSNVRLMGVDIAGTARDSETVNRCIHYREWCSAARTTP